MEFLRFGSSIPGSYWGCCAADIIQNFKVDPDAPASIQIVNGDGGYPMLDTNNRPKYLGKTWKEVFLQRLRIGTFNTTDMPNHAFFAIITAQQLRDSHGKKWLAILKEQGFEFFRSVSNSVYTGSSLAADNAHGEDRSVNHIFVLVRNIGKGFVQDPFTPPEEWTSLPKVVPEAWEGNTDAKAHRLAQKALWGKLPASETFTEQELIETKVPIWQAGVRSTNPQELKERRDERNKAKTETSGPKAPAPFGAL